MCVNDLLCTGAEPLFFLDYVAMGKDDPARLEKIVQGISDGCVLADTALLGSETAIVPNVWHRRLRSCRFCGRGSGAKN